MAFSGEHTACPMRVVGIHIAHWPTKLGFTRMSDLKRRVKWHNSGMNRNDIEKTEVDLWVCTAESRTCNTRNAAPVGPARNVRIKILSILSNLPLSI